MKVTRIQVTGAETEIRATIPAKYAKVEEDDETPTKGFFVKHLQPNGTFSDEVEHMAGQPIIAARVSSILARPVGYSAANVPATAEPYFKMRTTDASTVFVKLTEHEEIPRGV